MAILSIQNDSLFNEGKRRKVENITMLDGWTGSLKEKLGPLYKLDGSRVVGRTKRSY